jgi:hypothetical protein
MLKRQKWYRTVPQLWKNIQKLNTKEEIQARLDYLTAKIAQNIEYRKIAEIYEEIHSQTLRELYNKKPWNGY